MTVELAVNSSCRTTGGHSRVGQDLTNMLTSAQQKRIKTPLSRDLKELSIELAAAGELTEAELKKAAG
jgi:hypothetical protein